MDTTLFQPEALAFGSANECSRCPLSGTVSVRGGVSGLAGGARQSRGIDRGLHCCQTGGEGVLAHGQ